MAANATDGSANYYNPSALSSHQSAELSIGFISATPQLKLGGARSPVKPMRSLVLSLIAPGQLAQVPVAVGVAGQISGDRLSRIVTFTEDDQRWLLFDNRPEQVYLSGNVALSPATWLSLGAGYSFLASTSGRLSVTGRAVQPGFGRETEFDSALDHEVVADLSSVRYPQFAVTLSPARFLTFALVYRAEGQVSLEVDSNIDADVGIGPLDLPTSYVLESKTVQSFVPRQLVLGSSVEFGPMRVNIDVGWTEWSAYPSPLGATKSELDVQLPPGLLLDVPELPAATTTSSASMSDQFTARVGAEHVVSLAAALELPVRIGFAWDPTGATSQTEPSLLDADRMILSMGSGLNWTAPAEMFPGKVEVDWHAQWVELRRRAVRSPSGGTPLKAQGRVLGFGANLSYEFSR